MQKRDEKDQTVCVTVYLDLETNQKLIKAVSNSKRSKRAEITVRIKDHLNKFPGDSNKF